MLVGSVDALTLPNLTLTIQEKIPSDLNGLNIQGHAVDKKMHLLARFLT